MTRSHPAPWTLARRALRCALTIFFSFALSSANMARQFPDVVQPTRMQKLHLEARFTAAQLVWPVKWTDQPAEDHSMPLLLATMPWAAFRLACARKSSWCCFDPLIPLQARSTVLAAASAFALRSLVLASGLEQCDLPEARPKQS